MPNGGVRLSCFVCSRWERPEKGSKPKLYSLCRLHQTDTFMGIICTDFTYYDSVSDNDSRNRIVDRLTPQMLHIWMPVLLPDLGYPQPTELVPLAAIDDYKMWNDEKKQEAIVAARKTAIEMYNKRLSQ